MNPITNEPALYLKDKDLLVIADLHIGIEYELSDRGISIGSRVRDLIERVRKLSKKLRVKRILILGDLKHAIPRSGYRERRDLSDFLRSLEGMKLYLVPGNHDGRIRKLVGDEIDILPSGGVVMGSVAFAHGHRWPDRRLMKAKTLVLAHTHPTFSLRDRFGYRFTERCWVLAKPNIEILEERYGNISLERVVVMPAFNPLCGGISVNEEGLIGIVDKVVDKKDLEVFLMDGTYIGRISR